MADAQVTEKTDKQEDSGGVRLLHTMIRVCDLDASIDFYTRLMGMELLRRKDFPTGKFTLAFVGYGSEDGHTAIELTHTGTRRSRIIMAAVSAIWLSPRRTSISSVNGWRRRG